MEEIYSEIMYYSLNKNSSAYAQIRISFDEPINIADMEKALAIAIKRYPYFLVKLQKEGERYCIEKNDAPFLLYRDPTAPTLDKEKNNNHLWRVSADGKLLNVCFCHALTDGRGIYPFINTLLHYYCVERYGFEPNIPAVDLVGSKIDEEEIKDPFLSFDTSSVEAPPKAAETKKIFRLPNEKDPSGDTVLYTFSADSNKFMSFARNNDSSPNALLAIFLAKMLSKLYPDETDNIVISIAVDLRQALGVKRAHHCAVSVMPIRYSRRLLKHDLQTQATCVRGMMILKSDPDFLKPTIARSIGFYGYIGGLKTLAEKKNTAAFAITNGSTQYTMTISYPGKQDYGKMNEHISSFHIIAESCVAAVNVEITSYGGRFFFSFMQNFKDERYIKGLLAEFKEVGLEYSDPKEEIIPPVPFFEL